MRFLAVCLHRSKEPYIQTKEPCISPKELYIPSNEPYFSLKKPCIQSKEPCTQSKEPCDQSKEPCIQSQETQHPVKRALFSTNRADTLHRLTRTLFFPAVYLHKSKEPHTRSKEPFSPSKEPCFQSKELEFLLKWSFVQSESSHRRHDTDVFSVKRAPFSMKRVILSIKRAQQIKRAQYYVQTCFLPVGLVLCSPFDGM